MSEPMLLWKLKRGYMEAVRRKLERLLVDFDAAGLGEVLGAAEDFDLEPALVALGRRRMEQLTRGLTRKEWVMGLRRQAKDRGFTESAEDSFDFINVGKEQWVILEDVELALMAPEGQEEAR